jgi:hypothetical protein
MSKEEQQEAVAEGVKELEALQEAKAGAQCNTQIEAFHDARATLQHIKTEVCYISSIVSSLTGILHLTRYITYMHTPTLKCWSSAPAEMLKTSSSPSSSQRVIAYVISFMYLLAVTDLACRMEAYNLSGVQGTCISIPKHSDL